MKTSTAGVLALWLMASSLATEFHVSKTATSKGDGTRENPFPRIQIAAELATAGDIITVHEGTYRERVAPRTGGSSDRPIVYRAAPDEKVAIKGSEVMTNWTKVSDDVWSVSLPNSFFGPFNPYKELIRGDWFDPRGRQHHTGAVYVDGDWLIEAASKEELFKLRQKPALWFAEVGTNNTILWAQFPGVSPNDGHVEINVRQTVFYPERPGVNYITVHGFTLSHAATPWAPPTAEQIGLIGTHWSKGWIIESNVVEYSVCSGIALGKYGDEWDNTSANTAEGYVKTIERALKNGWSKEKIGHHLVRNNVIAHCEQAGIVGSLGAAFSEVRGNVIHDIHVRRLFSGAEMAGIKFHGAVDTIIEGNHIYRTCRGLWLDWMAQGTRVSCNLFHDNAAEDLFLEVNHGPFVIDNNLFLSRVSLLDMSEGGAYVHNLFAGSIVNHPEPNRETPYHPAHSTALAGLMKIRGGDDRFFNNVFAGENSRTAGLSVYDSRELPLQTMGNIYYNGTSPYAREQGTVVLATPYPRPSILLDRSFATIHFESVPKVWTTNTFLVSSSSLGETAVAKLPFESPEGNSLAIGTDYFGKPRNRTNPVPGPFETTLTKEVKVWPR